ncbi:polysaccharide biosynthesis tyrosine autokinase [Rathayibacter soli]|uniref:polysaccharide biosynthesis tyrosine autokinase n=1 Tax=Rathayibacter soli TaxID=3144168 RepID=UPI0027E4AF52|nr:polysaccharide biosynthesis tyrosine autokinase [Glaciibacter superstes]
MGDGMELRDYLHGLRRRWAAIVLLTVLGVGIAAAWAAMQPRVYETSASAYITIVPTTEPATPGQTQTIAPGQSNAITQSYVASFTDLASWRSVAQHAISELKLSATPESLVGQITVTNPTNTSILQVQAKAASPAAAQALAGAWIRGLQATIDQVDGNGKPGSAPVNVLLGDPAALPHSPISPDVKLALTVGGVVGLGFGIAFALIRAASDRRIRPGDAIDQKLGVAVVGTIPLVADKNRDSTGRSSARDATFAYSEALRTMRTNLQFVDVDNPPRTIVITSPLPGDGKSRIACELAKTLAATGSPVILVDGDLRRSTVAKNLGLPGGAGLADVLAGRVRLAEVLQQAPGVPNLLVLTAGSTPPNPSEVLGSARMRALLGELATDGIVIIDAPPLLSVTDAAVLAHQADGALLVTRAGKTTYELAEKALEALHKARGRTLGVVLNRVPLRGVDASPYAYAYRKSYLTDVDTSGDGVMPQPASPVPSDGGGNWTLLTEPGEQTATEPAGDGVQPRGGDANDDIHQLLGSVLDKPTAHRSRKSSDHIRRS